MGTRPDNPDLKEEAKKRSYLMAKLHRGCIDILRTKHDSLGSTLLAHIRSFDSTADEDHYAYVESLGFWRMIIELIFHIYILCSLYIGIFLIVALVLISWPMRFLVEVFSASWFLGPRQPYQPMTDPQYQEKIPPSMDAPESGDVVRRVVYEEAKVPKK